MVPSSRRVFLQGLGAAVVALLRPLRLAPVRPVASIPDIVPATWPRPNVNAVMAGWVDRGPWQYWDTVDELVMAPWPPTDPEVLARLDAAADMWGIERIERV